MTHNPGSRFFLAALCACALLSAAALLPARTALNVGSAKGRTGSGEWTVLAPVSYKNLTIFPVRARGASATDAYITLDEGTKQGTVVITEKGAQAARPPRHRRGAANRQVQQAVSYDAGASVNELALVNRSGRKLLLVAGEVVVGGQQDRIVQEDRIIPPVSVPVALNVFCVEHGRWTPRATSYSGGGGTSGGGGGTSGNAANVVARERAPIGVSAERAPAAEVVEDATPAKFSSLGAVAHPKLRAAAQDKQEQTAVWSEVQKNNEKLRTQNSTDTYQEVYANKEVSVQLDDYIRALEREVLQPGVVGVVVARNGQPVWADLFASPTLFAGYWPKLLKSYAVDALGDDTSEKRPTVAEAARYLEARDGTVATTTQTGVYQLIKTENPAYAVFELRDISLNAPLRLHFNKMDR
ncbi:MAG TPA: DUF6569 family protein [Pyrinomonadaceae bacterium]|jgi:hypothetical protein|nr:DUF6569 family protein [Pyrinomonadaceae bacterium]